MQFGSRIKRNFWTTVVLGLVPDSLIGAAVAYVTGAGLVGIFFTVFGLQCLYLVLFLKDLIWGWFLFWIGGRKKFTSHLLSYLREQCYPEPGNYHPDADGYFNDIVENSNLPCEQRVKAASELVALQTLRRLGHYGQALKLAIAYEDAIQQYKELFNAQHIDRPPDIPIR
jgi:hypothetical protein